MPDFFFVALIGGAIAIAAVAVLANLRAERAFEARFGNVKRSQGDKPH